jgi:hypothetical protein
MLLALQARPRPRTLLVAVLLLTASLMFSGVGLLFGGRCGSARSDTSPVPRSGLVRAYRNSTGDLLRDIRADVFAGQGPLGRRGRRSTSLCDLGSGRQRGRPRGCERRRGTGDCSPGRGLQLLMSGGAALSIHFDSGSWRDSSALWLDRPDQSAPGLLAVRLFSIYMYEARFSGCCCRAVNLYGDPPHLCRWSIEEPSSEHAQTWPLTVAGVSRTPSGRRSGFGAWS